MPPAYAAPIGAPVAPSAPETAPPPARGVSALPWIALLLVVLAIAGGIIIPAHYNNLAATADQRLSDRMLQAAADASEDGDRIIEMGIEAENMQRAYNIRGYLTSEEITALKAMRTELKRMERRHVSPEVVNKIRAFREQLDTAFLRSH